MTCEGGNSSECMHITDTILNLDRRTALSENYMSKSGNSVIEDLRVQLKETCDGSSLDVSIVSDAITLFDSCSILNINRTCRHFIIRMSSDFPQTVLVFAGTRYSILLILPSCNSLVDSKIGQAPGRCGRALKTFILCV